MQKKNQAGSIGSGLAIVLAVFAVLVVCFVGIYGYAASIQREGLEWETDLNAAVRVEVSERATYETSIAEQLGLAEAKTDAIRGIIAAALEGRYGDNPNQGQALFQSVTEAYPGTEGTAIYDKILTGVQAGREAIRNKQNQRIELAQKYNFWRKEGLVRPWVLARAGYPSADLTFKVGSTLYSGADALAKMAEPLSTADVNQSFESGVEKPVIKK